jgi:hypothetical protein
MAITTYLSSTNAELLYPLSSGVTNFGASLKALALSESFGMVNAAIDSQVIAPVIAKWDGESALESIAPLALLQARYYRWYLEWSNAGDTSEMQEALLAINAYAQEIRKKLVDIPALTPEAQVGWHITELTNASNIGTIYVRGPEPVETYHYKLVITSSGARYVGDGAVTFSVFRSDNDSALTTGTVATCFETWQTIDSRFEVKWDGQWTLNDEVQITGTPRAAVNTSGEPSNFIRSRTIA